MFNHETALADDDQRRAAGSLEVRDQLDIYVIGMIGAIWAGHWLGTGALVGQLRADPMITGLRWRAWFHCVFRSKRAGRFGRNGPPVSEQMGHPVKEAKQAAA